MKNLQLINAQTLTTTSKIVADTFGKTNSVINRSIRNIIEQCSPEFASCNIALVMESTTYVDSLGTSVPKETGRTSHYNLTKDGFMMVAMSLTGKEAMQWKERFINEFNRLTEQNKVLKEIVWEQLQGVNYINQSIALKLAGINHPRLFMNYMKEDEKFLNSMIKTNRIRNMRCGKSQEDTCWKFTQAGFEWLLNKRDGANNWVATTRATK